MEPEVVIKVEGLYKKFCRSIKRSMLYGTVDVARNMFGIDYDSGKLRKQEFWSLQDINLELRKGQAIGIIGTNGSGKTTLLRLINGIFPPDKGSITIRGKIGALIAVGAGFHPHMTGRENIYLNGTILGMTKEEIDRKFDDIVKFADIGDFMDAPVATYSSGMHVRLGFSIAIHSEPEILLADEILAVGDLSFTLKCYRKISEYRKKGGSIILVSHGMQLVRNICDHVIWMEKGQIREVGPTQEICDHYETFMLQKDAEVDENTLGTHINNDPAVQVTNVEFLNAADQVTHEFKTGEKFKMRLHYDCARTVVKPIFTVGILNAENILLVGNYTNFDMSEQLPDLKGKGYIDFVIDSLIIKPSNYLCTITFAERELANVMDWHEKSFTFSVVNNDKVAYGLLQPATQWQLHQT